MATFSPALDGHPGEEDWQLKLAPGFQEASARQALAEEIRAYLERPR